MLLSDCMHYWQLGLILAFLSSFLTADAYFVVNQPSSSTIWKNGSPFPLSWTIGLLEEFQFFDVEIARLSKGGVYLVANQVPVTMKSLNVVLQDVPAGDDFFLLCRDAGGGITYAVSSRFSVAAANSTGSNPNPVSAPTVTVSGIPNALSQYAATYGPSATNGAWGGIQNQVTAISVVIGAALVGGVLALS